MVNEYDNNSNEKIPHKTAKETEKEGLGWSVMWCDFIQESTSESLTLTHFTRAFNSPAGGIIN